MHAQAKYTVLVPQKDNLGNDLGDIASAAHHWLFYGPGPKVNGSFIERNVSGNWRDNPQEPFDRVVTFAHDTPEMDSTMKQLGAHIGHHANQWGVFITKEGQKGPDSWVVSNPNYVDGAPGILPDS